MIKENPKYTQLNNLIEQVRSKISDIFDLPSKINLEESNAEDPQKEIYIFLNDYNMKFSRTESSIPKVYNSKVYENLIWKFNRLLDLLLDIEKKILAEEEVKNLLSELSFLFNDIKPENYRLEFSATLKTIDNLRYIYRRISQAEIPFDTHQKIIDYINFSNEKEDYIIMMLVDLYNKAIEAIEAKGSERANDFQRQIKNTAQEIENNIRMDEIVALDDKINELRNETDKVRENIELEKNDPLIIVYKNFSEKQDKKIHNLSILISLIFIILILSILIEIIILLIYPEILKLLNFKFYAYQLSLYLVTSAFLAYLIKEKIRYFNTKNYCDKTWLELSSLPAYMTEFSKEERVNLRIRLAEKYFSGPYNDLSKMEATNDFNPNTVIELTKAMNDIKNK
ncbi:hypothetical protein ACT42M_11300 [Acinetobacter baumannii]